MMDAILLARMRDAGLEDGMIRFLHDVIVGDDPRWAEAARYLASTAVGGPVRFYGPDEGVTAELQLAPGIHWTGRAVRVARKRLPDTVLASVVGWPMSKVVDFDGADGLTITGASVATDGSTWLAATKTAVDPPPRPAAAAAARFRRMLEADHEARPRSALDAPAPPPGTGSPLILAIMATALVLAAVWIRLAWTGSHHKTEALAPIAALLGGLMCLHPKDRYRGSSAKQHMREMRALQAEQGW